MHPRGVVWSNDTKCATYGGVFILFEYLQRCDGELHHGLRPAEHLRDSAKLACGTRRDMVASSKPLPRRKRHFISEPLGGEPLRLRGTHPRSWSVPQAPCSLPTNSSLALGEQNPCDDNGPLFVVTICMCHVCDHEPVMWHDGDARITLASGQANCHKQQLQKQWPQKGTVEDRLICLLKNSTPAQTNFKLGHGSSTLSGDT